MGPGSGKTIKALAILEIIIAFSYKGWSVTFILSLSHVPHNYHNSLYHSQYLYFSTFIPCLYQQEIQASFYNYLSSAGSILPSWKAASWSVVPDSDTVWNLGLSAAVLPLSLPVCACLWYFYPGWLSF